MTMTALLRAAHHCLKRSSVEKISSCKMRLVRSGVQETNSEAYTQKTIETSLNYSWLDIVRNIYQMYLRMPKNPTSLLTSPYVSLRLLTSPYVSLLYTSYSFLASALRNIIIQNTKSLTFEARRAATPLDPALIGTPKKAVNTVDTSCWMRCPSRPDSFRFLYVSMIFLIAETSQFAKDWRSCPIMLFKDATSRSILTRQNYSSLGPCSPLNFFLIEIFTSNETPHCNGIRRQNLGQERHRGTACLVNICQCFCDLWECKSTVRDIWRITWEKSCDHLFEGEGGQTADLSFIFLQFPSSIIPCLHVSTSFFCSFSFILCLSPLPCQDLPQPGWGIACIFQFLWNCWHQSSEGYHLLFKVTQQIWHLESLGILDERMRATCANISVKGHKASCDFSTAHPGFLHAICWPSNFHLGQASPHQPVKPAVCAFRIFQREASSHVVPAHDGSS